MVLTNTEISCFLEQTKMASSVVLTTLVRTAWHGWTTYKTTKPFDQGNIGESYPQCQFPTSSSSKGAVSTEWYTFSHPSLIMAHIPSFAFNTTQ